MDLWYKHKFLLGNYICLKHVSTLLSAPLEQMHTLDETVPLIPEVVRLFFAVLWGKICRKIGRTASSIPGHFHWSLQTVFILESKHPREIFKEHAPNRFHHITFLRLFHLCRGKSQCFFPRSCLSEERKKGYFIRTALLRCAMCTVHASGHSILVFYSRGYFKISGATYIRDKSGIRISQPISGWAIENYYLHFLPKFL